MKFVKPAGLFLSAMMALTVGTVGCKKNPDRLTNIGGYGPSSKVGDERPAEPITTPNPNIGNQPPIRPLPPIEPVAPVPAIPTNETGTPASTKDFSTWKQDRETFAAQTVYFDFDKSNVKPGEVSKLEEVVRRMKTMTGKALLIEGHCDERGTEEYNRSLGDRRALSVREWLSNNGFPADMITTISFGEDKPVDPGHNDEAWRKNRRGEIILLSPN